jgi:bifunctional DNA-binding transcriptional regulator/antitoxin component of YhaV-PrlF toxin-antitoxin module
MAIVIARLQSKNLIYVPSEFLDLTGLSITKNMTMELDLDTNKIVLTPLSEKLAKKARDKIEEFEREINSIRKSQKDLHRVKEIEESKKNYLKYLGGDN